jgi:hypothetical protein
MAYTPRAHGQMAVNDEMPYTEQFWNFEASAGFANNSGWNTIAAGSFILPWPGQAIAEMQVFCTWSGYQQVGARLTASSPAPVQASDLPRIGDNAYGAQYSSMPVFARWELATVQTVTVTLQFFVGGGGNGANFYRLYGSIRGYAS